VGLVNSEMNYFLERGYFVSTLTGGEVTAAVTLPKRAPDAQPLRPVLFDVRLGVPVPIRQEGAQVVFTTWIPLAQPAAFALALDGTVRLFGDGTPTGDGPDVIAERTRTYTGNGTLA
jgi:hypothetical protein